MKTIGRGLVGFYDTRAFELMIGFDVEQQAGFACFHACQRRFADEVDGTLFWFFDDGTESIQDFQRLVPVITYDDILNTVG